MRSCPLRICFRADGEHRGKQVGDIVYGDFEWDKEKARRNLRIHFVSFEEATTVFDDPLAIIEQSAKHSVGETRYVIIGLSERNQLLAVAHTLRWRIRIISARWLTPRERREYENQTKER